MRRRGDGLPGRVLTLALGAVLALALAGGLGRAAHADPVLKLTSRWLRTQELRRVGTGVAFAHAGRAYVLTSEHVVWHGNEAADGQAPFAHEAGAEGEAPRPARFLRSDWARGLALLELTGSPGPDWPTLAALALDARLPISPRERLRARGYPAQSRILLEADGGAGPPAEFATRLLPAWPGLLWLPEGYGEFGMSGGPVMAEGGAFVGVISHNRLLSRGGGAGWLRPGDDPFSIQLLLIPAIEAVAWAEASLGSAPPPVELALSALHQQADENGSMTATRDLLLLYSPERPGFALPHARLHIQPTALSGESTRRWDTPDGVLGRFVARMQGAWDAGRRRPELAPGIELGSLTLAGFRRRLPAEDPRFYTGLESRWANLTTLGETLVRLRDPAWEPCFLAGTGIWTTFEHAMLATSARLRFYPPLHLHPDSRSALGRDLDAVLRLTERRRPDSREDSNGDYVRLKAADVTRLLEAPAYAEDWRALGRDGADLRREVTALRDVLRLRIWE